MASIGTISNGESGSSVRSKLNLAIAEANKVTAKLDTSQKGAPSGVATLDATGLVPTSQLPNIAAGRKVTVADEAARLALSVYPDLTIAYQTDTGDAWALNANDDPSVPTNWTMVGNSQAGGVTSFNGRTGNVTPQSGDYTAGQVGAIAAGEKGVANGVATLDENGQLFPSQLPGLGGGGYNVATVTSTAGQVHVFTLPAPQYSFGYDAFALRQETGLENQSLLIENFDSGSADDYEQTDALVWNGELSSYTGEYVTPTLDDEFYSAPIRADGFSISIVNDVDALFNDGSMIAKYEFNGNLIDSIDNSSLSVIYGSEKYSTSFFGEGFMFDGSTELRKNESLFLSEITYSFWASNLPSSISLVFEGSEPNKMMLHTRDGGFRFAFNGSSTVVDLDVDLSGSNHWVVMYDSAGGLVKIYRNGVLSGQAAVGSLSAFNSSYIEFGGRDGEYLLNAVIDQVRIFSRAISETEVLALYYEVNPSKLLIKGNLGEYYSVTNGVLTEVPTPISSSDFDTYGTDDTGEIQSDQIAQILPVDVVTASPIYLKTTYTPYNQIAFEQPQPVISWQQINSATLTAAQTGVGAVRVAVSRDGINWHTRSGSAWSAAFTLTADTTGADYLIANGMTAATVNALSASAWADLFNDTEDGSPDTIAFAYALSVPDPTTDSASIESLTLNVDLKGAWGKQAAAEVEIRWYNDQVTFTTVSAGDYKLAYQAPEAQA